MASKTKLREFASPYTYGVSKFFRHPPNKLTLAILISSLENGRTKAEEEEEEEEAGLKERLKNPERERKKKSCTGINEGRDLSDRGGGATRAVPSSTNDPLSLAREKYSKKIDLLVGLQSFNAPLGSWFIKILSLERYHFSTLTCLNDV